MGRPPAHLALLHPTVVERRHWMSGVQFQNAVAWGQVTSGPGVATVWAFGDAARGFTRAVVTWLVAFARSFGFDLVGARQFERLRTNTTIESLLAGTGSRLNGASALP